MLWSLGTLNSNPCWNTYSNPQAKYWFNRNCGKSQCLRTSVCWIIFGRLIIAWCLFVATYLLCDFSLFFPDTLEEMAFADSQFSLISLSLKPACMVTRTGQEPLHECFFGFQCGPTLSKFQKKGGSWKILQDPSLPLPHLGSSGHSGVKKIRLKRLWLAIENQRRYTGLTSKAE